ncbi:MAG: hypothetical protein KDA81_22255, partial [Planctomycetaceae bacterium]|nr:hypothetical protein [Planctomycetaceae bacterium]
MNLHRGGGVYAFGDFTISNSTLNANYISGPGQVTDGAGGGIAVRSPVGANQRIVNSTISGNRAWYGGGVYQAFTAVNQTGLMIEDSTLTLNQGDPARGGSTNLWIDGRLHSLTNSIFDNDPSTSFSDVHVNTDGGLPRVDGKGSITSAVRNLVNRAVGDTSAFQTGGNIQGQSAQLGPLADNGGPTFTHALGINSPAIDAGNSTRLTDQRGQYIKNESDIGAFETDITAADWRSFTKTQGGSDTVPSKVSQFSETDEEVAMGIGFDDGQPQSSVPKDPGFLGVTLDTQGQYGIGDDFLRASVGYDIEGKVGVEYGYYVNAGSVTVDYNGSTRYRTVANGNDYTIQTVSTLNDGHLFTESPRIGAYLDGRIDLNALIQANAYLFGVPIDLSLPHIDVDKTIPIVSINRQEQDADGNPLFIDRTDGTTRTTNSNGGLNAPAFDGDIKLANVSPTSYLGDAAATQNGLVKEIWDAREQGNDSRVVSLGDTGLLDKLCL